MAKEKDTDSKDHLKEYMGSDDDKDFGDTSRFAPNGDGFVLEEEDDE